MKRNLLLITILAALLVGIVAPTASVQAAPRQQSHTQIFDRTRFLFHMGLAYFAFHHFVYAKWKAGDFKKGANHRLTHIIAAGAALLFTYHELKLALNIANGSHSRLLHALAKPLNSLSAAAGSIANKLRGGQYSDSEVSQLTNSVNGFGTQAQKNGYKVLDIGAGVPGFGS